MTNQSFQERQLALEALGDRLEAMDKLVEDWGKATVTKMLRRLAGMGLKQKLVLINSTERKKRQSLMRSLKIKLKRREGILERISFSFIRHGIFYEQGVGRGRTKGSGNVKTNPWIKPVLDAEIEELSTLIAERYADLAVEELKINIPGIISTKVKVG